MTQDIRKLAVQVIGACMLVASFWIVGADANDRPISSSNAKVSREYLLKAAFLYNFAKFTTWPQEAAAGPKKAVRLCVLGRDPFGAAMGSIEGKSIKQRRLVTLRIADVSDARKCHIVFIGRTEEERLRAILDHLRQRPILTIAEMSNFAQVGGMIGFKTIEDRIRFDINVEAAAAAHLRISHKLLRLANIVGMGTN